MNTTKSMWKSIELNDVERMNCEGLETFEELDMNALEMDYDSFVHSLLSKKKDQQQMNDKKEEDVKDVNPNNHTSMEHHSDNKLVKKKKKKPKSKTIIIPENNNHTIVVDNNNNIKEEEAAIELNEEWLNMGIESSVLQCLHKMKFNRPTPIQKESIPLAIQQQKDIVAAAETGSGKTLAFGIPIISQLLKEKEENQKMPCYLEALILVPTRELAKQVSKHIRNIISNQNASKIRIINVFGGLSEAKQNRLLNSRPNIIVATPGRFWDFCQRGFDFLIEMQHLKYLVIDEADRMFSQGHFPELLNILRFIEERRRTSIASDEEETDQPPLPRIQKFVSSATLTLENEEIKQENGSSSSSAAAAALNQLIEMMKMSDYALVNVFNGRTEREEMGEEGTTTTTTLLPNTLTEAQLSCGDEGDKLVIVYYFLLTYPGRTLIFTNTIKKARMIHQLFHGVLGIEKVNILHGEMQQRARLKNLDRFSGIIGAGAGGAGSGGANKSHDKVLVATDVAARGLDIPDVKHVIHFDIPHKPDVYIHRCGRSGRASKEGFSLALVSPEDRKAFQSVCDKAHKGQEMLEFPCNGHYYSSVPLLRRRIKLAVKIEEKERKNKRKKTDENWFKRNAEEMDIELDDHFFPGMTGHNDSDDPELFELHPEDKELASMKRELSKLMKQKIQERKDRNIISNNYITATQENFDLLTQSDKKPEDALLELKNQKNKLQKKNKKQKRPSSDGKQDTQEERESRKNKRRKAQ